MWFGTKDGLNKYDGYGITVYRHDPDDPVSIPDNYIESIYEDSSGVLWVGTQDGWLARYEPEADQFINYQVGSHVLALFEDRAGIFWIGTQNPGLLQFDRETGMPAVIREGGPYTLFYEDQVGSLYTFCTGDGLSRYNREQERFELVLETEVSVSSLVEERPGVFWIGTPGEGLILYDLTTEQYTTYSSDSGDPAGISDNWIYPLCIDMSGSLWVGTNNGLHRLDPETRQFTLFQNDPYDPYSLSSDLIRALYLDRAGVLWIGTATGGINKYYAGSYFFSHYQHSTDEPNSLGGDIVNTIYEDRDGLLWIGGEYGLSCLDRERDTWRHYHHDPENPNSLSAGTVFSIYEDRNGALWFGTDAGLDQYNRDNDQFAHYPLSVPNDMLEDGLGNFLIVAREGLYLFDPQEESPFVLLRSGYSWKITALIDRDGLLWMGTSGDGLERYDINTDTWISFRHDADDPVSLSHDFIESILEDRAGTLWFGTGGGLCRFDRTTESFTRFSTNDGLSNDWIRGVLEDSRGYLWLSTAGGLSRFDPVSETFVNYDMSDGLQDYRFRRGAYHKNERGELFFGGINGVNLIDPELVRENVHVPPVVVTAFNLFNQTIRKDLPPNTQIGLSYSENFLSFDFAALDYAAPEKNRYTYMMEGLDESWVDAGRRRHVDYPDLKPGHYVFRARGSNNDGLWNEQGASIRIDIAPPFWQTWWFRFICAFSLLLSAFLAYRKRINHLEIKRKELEERVTERTEAANALQTALSEVERLKIRLEAENTYLQDEIKLDHNFDHIITRSETLKRVLGKIEQVAATDATVLVLGESGTGKELLARAVHNISPRNSRPLVKVNCAVLPADLIESELFGHEKGAFTGAISRKIGRFELADGGTIFLDEIGEIPLALQSKLLRVLQEGEFERLGNPRTIKVDVRIIAATNRDLDKEKEEGRFREDLFYRLNVFPIQCPPLRDRKEDIPLLVRHFTDKYTKKIGKQIEDIPRSLVSFLKQYHWPGNVRELENVIERAVITSPGRKLELGDWRALKHPDASSALSTLDTLEQHERKHIVKALEMAAGRVSGDQGAANLLGINPNTLTSRMKKLGIKRRA